MFCFKKWLYIVSYVCQVLELREESRGKPRGVELIEKTRGRQKGVREAKKGG